MVSVANNFNNFKSFNNLLYTTQRNSQTDNLEHLAGHVPLDLRPKKPARPSELINASRAQINGKSGDLLYKTPFEQHSRPYYGYDAPFDPTILNATRYNLTDVSGLLITPKNLPKNKDFMYMSQRPYIPYGQIR